MSKENWKEKGLWVALSFPFYDIIFSVSGWLIQKSNMGKERCQSVPW